MNDIRKHITNLGPPDAIIDSWEKDSKKYAIWGFESCFEFYGSHCIIDGNAYHSDPIRLWQKTLDKWKNEINNKGIYAIGFISYDFKNELMPHLNIKQNNSNI